MTSNPPRSFLGWKMVGLGSVCYGLAISPMYYCWGFFLPEMQADLGMNDTQGGLIFSVFSWIYHGLGPVAGFAIGRWGIRSMMSLSAVVGVVAFWLMSRVESFADAMFAYAVLGGIAVGFGTILAAQALASNWFIRFRSRAMALILAGGAVVGYVTLRFFAPGILDVADWRTGWLIISGISALVAVLAAVFMRGEPERVGQEPDGGVQAREAGSDAPSGPTGHGEWTAPLALRTSQFYVLIGLSIAYGVPWGIIAVFGRHHLDALGFTTAIAGSILGARVLVSLFGRLSAFAGDFMTPQRLLGIVLILEGIGCALFIVANTELIAYLSMILIGLGFGAAYVCIPVVYSAFYGRRAFATTVGTRFAITGIIAPAAPTLAGMLSDWSDSHVLTLTILTGLCFVGSVVAFGLRAPVLGARPITPPAAG
ncbi:MAG: MFS transporter [Acidobacteria bacterium]|nr:MFS transporter [Acidobacteriota bacterium]